MCWCSLSPQWQSWHSARLWFPGELCVAGDDQRDRGEVGLPLQPWKPRHFLWGTTTVTQLACVRILFVKCLFCMLDWVASPMYVCMCVVSVDSLSSFLALQREHGVRAEVWASVQLAGQCEETESTPLIYQLPQQMESARLLSTTVNITSIRSVLYIIQPIDYTIYSLTSMRLPGVLFHGEVGKQPAETPKKLLCLANK